MQTDNWQSIICKIENFYSIKSADSWKFNVHAWSFFLRLDQNNFKDKTEDCFTLKLLTSEGACARELNFTVSTGIKDKFNKLHFVQCNNVSNYKSCLIWSVRRDDILDISDSLLDDPISFVVAFGPVGTIIRNLVHESYANEKEHKMIQTAFDGTNSACLESLSLDLSNLLNNEVESDIKIKCGDSAFAAHRIILSARSEVFAAMFRNDMTEKRNGCIEITDREPAVIKMFLQYVYSGTIPNLTDDIAPLLYSTADKYAVSALQGRCTEFMMQTLSEKNACRLLLLANGHDDSNFKRYIMEFIIKNEKVLLADEWFKLCDENPKLSTEVYREHMKYTTSQKKV